MYFKGENKKRGKRVSELTKKFNLTKMHHSNMIRAIETADLIKQELKQPDLPIFLDPLLAEGLPVLPEPALVQSDIYVIKYFFKCIKSFKSYSILLNFFRSL